MRYYARHGIRVERGTWPQVYLDGQEAPAGTVIVDGKFFSVEHHQGLVVTYIDKNGVTRQPRRATAVDELWEAICESETT